MKYALTIAGFDNSGGAGITADLRTFSAYGLCGLSVISSIVPQSPNEVRSVIPLPVKDIQEQFLSIKDFPAPVCKVGLLPSPEIVECVSDLIKGRKAVVDPIIWAGTGATLVSKDTLKALVSSLLPRAFVATPNVPEAELISGIKINDLESQKKASEIIHAIGPKHVVIKGGHLSGTDVLYDGKKFEFFSSEYLKTDRVHGTGCTYSSSICAQLALGVNVKTACANAKEFSLMSIQHALSVKGGRVANQAWGWKEVIKT
jgi:hydroxymethylpyrimidine/phosphomethylpyrimidine kinase